MQVGRKPLSTLERDPVKLKLENARLSKCVKTAEGLLEIQKSAYLLEQSIRSGS